MLSSLALRLAAIEGLRPTPALLADGPWPTLAKKHIYDSRIDPLEDLQEKEEWPIIVIYAEDDDSHEAGQKRGGPPYLLCIDLIFECSVVVKAAADADPQIFTVGWPETDAELEAALNLISAQIYFTLFYAPSGLIFRKVCASRVTNIRSTVHRTSEEGRRLARRTITWKVLVNGDDAYDPAPAQQLTGFALLPEPLKTVACMLPENSYGRRVIDGLIQEPTFPQMPLRVPLETVGLNVKAHLPGAAIPATPNIVGEVDDLYPSD